jgi:hypothetical protein
MAISFHTPCVQPPDLWDTISFSKGDYFIFFEIHQPGISEAKLPDCTNIMSGELALPDFGIGIIRKDHGSDAVRDDSCLLQFFMISPNMV